MESRPTDAKPSYNVQYFYYLSQCFKIPRLSSTNVTTTTTITVCQSLPTIETTQLVDKGELEAVCVPSKPKLLFTW